MKSFSEIIVSIGVLMAAGVFCSLPVQAEDSPREIKFGALLPETGTTGWVKTAYTGIDLAVKEVNDAGGVLGKKLGYIKKDTQSSPDVAKVGIQELFDAGVVAVVGPTSGEIFSVMDLAEKAGVPLISPTAGTTKLDDIKGRWAFRTTSSDKVMALGMSVEAMILGLKKGAIFCANTGSGISMAGAVEAAFPKVGGQIVSKIIFDEGKKSYQEELKALFDQKPDVVFWEASPAEGEIIFKERDLMKLGGLWIGSDYLNEDFLSKVQGAIKIDGILGILPAPAPSARLEAWKDQLKAATGASGVPSWSAQAYDAVILIALAIEAAGSDDKAAIYSKIRQVANPPGKQVSSFAQGVAALRQGEDIDYVGIAGRHDFNEAGDVIVDHVIRQVKNGAFVQIGVLTQDELSQYVK